MSSPKRLFAFAGLPGSGKSTLAQSLARAVGAAYVRIDTIEQGLRDLCQIRVEAEGYELAYRLAADNLRLGISVVADSCNPIALTRAAWAKVAREAGAVCINVEVICGDAGEHRRRVETRSAEVAGLKLPSWADVVARDYEAFESPDLRIDTAGQAPEQSLRALLSRLDELVDDPG